MSAPPSSETAAPPRRPLAVRLCNWVGEVVLALPTLRRLEAAGFALELIGKGWSPALLDGTGWPVHRRAAGLMAATRQYRALRRSLGARNSPDAFLLTKSFSSAFEARFGGWRPVGYARDGRSPLLAAAYPLPRFEHASHAYWHLASVFLGTEAPYPTEIGLVPSPAQRARAAGLLGAHALEARPFVVLCPFSGADDREGRKLWPGFGALGQYLAARGTPMIVCPGPGEDERAAALVPAAIRLPGVDLGTYAALLERAHAVVANDTGPGHLAAAVGARLVGVYGPQSVSAWAPLGARVTVLHEPSGWSPLEQVTALIG
jgi:heptosyltransferase-2